MKLEFSKYEGAGNDFIIVDNRSGEFTGDIKILCDRRFGIGADGLILLESDSQADFRMRFFNSDGGEATMCGNGGRCIAAFAFERGIAGSQQRFIAADGEHRAQILPDGRVSLQMNTPSKPEQIGDGWLINTGVPHYVEFGEFNVGRAHELRHQLNANVNFIQRTDNGITIRTFERGVEGETLACGTGAVAAAIVNNYELGVTNYELCAIIKALGGDLEVSRDADGNVWLTGGARCVFTGQLCKNS